MDSIKLEETDSTEIETGGKVFAQGVGPSTEPAPLKENTEEHSPNIHQEAKVRVPEYLSQENARNLFEKGVNEEEALTPLAFMYLLSQDKQDRKDPQNVDLRGALREQTVINELFLSRKELSPSEWENVFQSPSGWKEIRYAVENSTENQNFYEKTIRYLTVKAITAELNHENHLSRSLYKTIALMRNNFIPASNRT